MRRPLSEHEQELRKILDHCAEVEPVTRDRVERLYKIEPEEDRLAAMEQAVGSIWAALEVEQ